VDFTELIRRQSAFLREEKAALENFERKSSLRGEERL
jgi:hypothetical protein